jgi:hypothetical protein
LDDARRAVPIGSRGELYVAGPGVSAGYWQRPELTNERFITISIPGSGETLAYRTGDVARLTGDGSILFLGRRDYQVKINGYRIEIEEVENAINGIDGVQEAAVAVRENDAGSRQLAGFMRLTQGTTVDDIKERISAALPRYMVPTLLEAVDDFPRMPNGKVDRKSLSRLSLSLSSAQYAPPRNGVEQLQADLWAELLGRDRVGIEDDFFKLGGQSILATRLIAQLKDVLQLSVPVRMVFDNPTIARFTEALRRDQGRAPELDRIEAALADLDLEVVGP